MASNSFTNGVWRTIGGRRIFIQTGQSVGDAMKKSGKYKSKKEKYLDIPQEERVKAFEEGKNWKDLVKEKEAKRYEKEVKSMEQTRKDISKGKTEPVEKLKTENADRTPEKRYGKDVKSKTMDQYIEDHNKKIEAKAEKERWQKQYERDKAIANDKNQSKEMQEFAKRQAEGSQKKVDEFSNYEKHFTAREQTADIEAASGSKIKRSFETDLYGNGKADRFELNDGRYIEHTKEAFGKKEDSWSINKVENGSITSKDFKNYDDMKTYLAKEKSQKASVDMKTADVMVRGNQRSLEFEKQGLARAKRDNDHSSRSIRNISDRTRRVHEIEADLQRSKEHRNGIYRDAFNEYKRLHPNSKITLQRFIQMKKGN